MRIGNELRNKGGPGEVFVSVVWMERPDLKVSKVFHMDRDESVMLETHFSVLTSLVSGKVEWTARVALPGDTSQGELQVTRSNIKMVGNLDVGEAKDVAVRGAFAYVVVEKRWPYDHKTAFMADVRLMVIDVSSPSRPREVGRYDFNSADTSFSNYGIRATDRYVYVVIGHYDEHEDNGLHIIDVGNPSSPRRVGHYHIEGGATAIDIAGKYAYVTTTQAFSRKLSESTPRPNTPFIGKVSLLVLDISEPSNPEELGRYEPERAPPAFEEVVLKSNYAYVGSRGGLLIVDVSTAQSPKEVGIYSFSPLIQLPYVPDVYGISIAGNYAYLAGRILGILDISNPSAPALIGWGSVGGRDIAVSGSYAYLAGRDLSVFDVSDPSQPALVGRHAKAGGLGVAVSGDYVYVAGDGGLYILESKPVRKLIMDD